MRTLFYWFVALAYTVVAAVYFFWPPVLWWLCALLPVTIIGLYDIFYSSHNVLKNYPVLGHLRYMLEFISPEIHQYFVEGSHDGAPYNREQRKIIYERARGIRGTMPFGTQFDLMASGVDFAFHSIEPKTTSDNALRITLAPGGGHPYQASRLNISAMSFGALSHNAIRALNRGARLGNFCHNTGEGGLSPYHREFGGDICWQIGTGYFGCRTRDGKFEPTIFADIAASDQVKMIEIKISQGAKPSHGGVLPAAKITREIASIRMVPENEDCISPPTHSAFEGPRGLLEFIRELRELSAGKPVGFKLCIGRREQFCSIVKAMLETQVFPDFITIDGAEGGTGAAPYEFSDSLGLPLVEGLSFVHNVLVGADIRPRIRLIASGKISTGFDMIAKMALGADMVNMARPMMFAIGCIQARRCDTNTCPSGVATQDPRRGAAVNVKRHSEQVRNFHYATMQSFTEILGAMGYSEPGELLSSKIFRRVGDAQSRSYAELFPPLQPGELLGQNAPADYANYWRQAQSASF
jgi:hypothetical protein